MVSAGDGAPVRGAAVAAFLLIGLLVTGQAITQLSDPDNAGVFIGTVALFLGLTVALISGIAATVRSRGTVQAN